VLWQRVGSRCGLSVGALCLAVSATYVWGSAELPGFHSSTSQDANLPYPHLKLMREFSGASDVEKEPHPVLNRSLDIIAGPGDPRASIDRLDAPYAVTTDGAHRIFVTDPGAGVVHIFDFGQGKYALLGGKGSRIHSPSGIAIDGQGNVYISDSVEEAVLVYDGRGKFLHYLGRAGRNESLFQGPAGIAIQEASGDIYVCDSRRHMVLVRTRRDIF
jgi:NHL repeat